MVPNIISCSLPENCRVLASIVILGKACDLIDHHQEQKKATVSSGSPSISTPKKEKKTTAQRCVLKTSSKTLSLNDPSVSLPATTKKPAVIVEDAERYLPNTTSETYLYDFF
jgi:hypothetical protein